VEKTRAPPSSQSHRRFHTYVVSPQLPKSPFAKKKRSKELAARDRPHRKSYQSGIEIVKG
jgi:hypothetical protein